MDIETIIGCLEKEHFCSMCVNEDSECTGYGCVYANAAETIKKLQAENAALQARLDKAVELPCKVGDTVYILKDGIILKAKIDYMYIGKFGLQRFYVSGEINQNFKYKYFGKTVFLTEAEALARLDEMKGGAK